MTDIEKNYARCFSCPSGAIVLAHLRNMTIERTFGANATNEELRWGAAQSALVRQIESLVARGRGNQT